MDFERMKNGSTDNSLIIRILNFHRGKRPVKIMRMNYFVYK